MKAAIRRRYGGPNQIQIEEIQKPSVQPDEILVRIAATTVNRTDCANLTAKPFIMRFFLGLFKPRKIILGTDFAGTVVGVGENVKDFKLEDRVFGFSDGILASQAAYITVPAKKVFRIPENIDFKHAAASLEGAHYAYTFIAKTNIQPGQRILINGATGAIGSSLVQFVRQFDVHLAATCGTENVQLIQSLGVDRIIDYKKQDFCETKDKYDFIFDAVGKSTFGKCKPLLSESGVYISSELGPYSQNVFYALTSFSRKKNVIFPIPFSPMVTIPFIIDLLKAGKYKPLIDREYSLDAIAEAYAYVMTGMKIGNVVINLQSTEENAE